MATENITATSTGEGSSVTFTSTAHGLDSFDRVAISGTTSYDGNYGPGQTGQGITVLTADTFSVSGVTNSEANEGAVSGVTWTSLFNNDFKVINRRFKNRSWFRFRVTSCSSMLFKS